MTQLLKNDVQLKQSIEECTPECGPNDRQVYGGGTGCCFICETCRHSEIIVIISGTNQCQKCPLFQIPDVQHNSCIPAAPGYGTYKVVA